MKNKTYIIKKLKKHISQEPLSFHTPGHKNGRIIPNVLKGLWPSSIWQYDLTEIENLDNLQNPQGCIKKAQEETARLFGARKSYFLVNGTSVGIQGAIMALSLGKSIFVPRHVHKSVYNGIILADAKPFYLPISVDYHLGIPLGIEPEVLEENIIKYPNCKNIILPNPTYQGISYKVEEIVNICKREGINIILDEAHGSHFAFNKALPKAGLEMGADVVIQSWHKTLPTLTQASVLHINKDYCGPDISEILNMLQTTSPSYLLLSSLEATSIFMGGYGEDLLAATISQVEVFLEGLASLKTIKIADFSAFQNDPLKLVLYSERLQGQQLAEILAQEYRIYAELAEENYCLLLLGIKTEEKIFKYLANALQAIDQESLELPLREKNILQEWEIPQTGFSLKEAFFKEKEEIKTENAEGRICGEYIIKYPPGVPLFVPGERIEKRILESQGYYKSKLVVVKE